MHPFHSAAQSEMQSAFRPELCQAGPCPCAVDGLLLVPQPAAGGSWRGVRQGRCTSLWEPGISRNGDELASQGLSRRNH